MTIVYSYEKGQLPTAQDITNFYLYGQKDKPAEMLDPSTWAINKPDSDGMVRLQIDYATFLKQMARFFDASSFEFV